MEDSYGEGLAIHTGPESCAVDREVGGEALTADGKDQPGKSGVRERIGPRVMDYLKPSRRKPVQVRVLPPVPTTYTSQRDI